MLSKELKIGNILKPNWDEDYISISAQHIVEQAQADKAETQYLQPIDITKEWLLKLGFVEREDEAYINNYQYLMQVTDEDTDDENPINRNGTWFDGIATFDWKKTGHLVVNALCRGNYITYSVGYVHELQNLYFALSGGKELKLKT